MEAAISEAHNLTVGVSDEGEQLQLLWAMRQQLSVQPELALDMAFGAFVTFEYLKVLRAGEDVERLLQLYREHALYEDFTSVIALTSDDFGEWLADFGMPPADAEPADSINNNSAAAASTAASTEPLGAITAPCPARSLAPPVSTAPSAIQMASDGGSYSLKRKGVWARISCGIEKRPRRVAIDVLLDGPSLFFLDRKTKILPLRGQN